MEFLELLSQNLYIAVLGGFFLQGMGIPIPLTVLLGILGYLFTQGLLTLPLGVFIMFLGSFLGNLLGYFVGYKYGYLLLERFSNKKIDKIIEKFAKWGPLGLIVLRLPSWGFVQLIWLLGTLRSPFLLFTGVLVFANLIWSIVFVYFSKELLFFIQRFY